MDQNRFLGKTVMVTGAGSGLGAAVFKRFLLEGANVIGVDLSAESMERFRERNSVLSGQMTLKVGDVGDSDAIEAIINESVEELGALDVLVNNAGIAPTGPAAATSNELWRSVMKVNVDGLFYATRAALPHLIRSQGNIVNTASVSGIGADYNYAAYDASKGAVLNFTRSVAVDYAQRGVRCNAVAPGPVLTPLLQKNLDSMEGLKEAFGRSIPLGRIAASEEIAPVFTFLASPDASYVNGHILTADGGVTAWNGQPNPNDL
ncbi:SDR family oxidoreductase [Arthrobacter sp. M2012083]|uniref:SDR family NAD(P)-dependent oxidoreductase n=1 Tax=Arthrobacter sp. M2012083 TaxID=1197706 RepID=UPI0002E73324|nr:SDR family oxidoreductase [Arthrobacter sp. M2012083]